MIITNTILTVGFAVVSNFASIVGVPQNEVPKSTNDLSSYTIGDPHSQADIYFTHKCGTMYGIRDGAVQMFEAAQSYVHLQNSARLPQLMGKPSLSSSQALELAAKTVNRLVKGRNPIAGITPVVRLAGTNSQGQEIPFYSVIWRKPYKSPGFDCFGAIEIDARTARISCLELHDSGFGDPRVLEQLMTNTQVGVISSSSESDPSLRSFAKFFPSPHTNEVVESIASWLWFCTRLKLNPGGDTTPSKVDWQQTCLFTNRALVSAKDNICRVQLQSGAWFHSVRGVVFAHNSSDCYFAEGSPGRPRPERSAMRGKINYRWQELAEKLEHALVEDLGLPEEYLRRYSPHAEPEPPSAGTIAENRRVLVLWTYPHEWKYQGFGAEFDLESGEIKDIGFTDSEMIRALARAQGKTL